MADQELIERIKKDFVDFQNQGNDIVKIDNVLVYLDGLSKDIANNVQDVETQRLLAKLSHERDMEYYKAVHQAKMADINRLQEDQRLLTKYSIELGQNTLRYAVLINGGAAVAMLAFIGNIASRCQSVSGYLAWGAIWFSLGVLASALSSGSGYFSQCYYAVSFQKRKENMIKNINENVADKDKLSECIGCNEQRNGDWWRYIAIGFALFGYVFFLVGIFAAYKGMV
ncbi:hypothetical protein [Anaeroarcus burkinensis]|uniref:hypothetical protein n=1 Tax=Anaeroarcus burkinensis TaxID=82376 RepID=UPI0004218C63|nr:hypothetical protein [Anaeroarcus burkinensis]